ncbi:MAG: glutamate racemase [Deltaproteobacteria bacterium]|nr:glutamate racemase [Deltaproteobacteria bacterium]
MSEVRDRPIGVFDSGIGGLTVLRALRRALPGEAFLYLGDTARVPYGTKSPATVTRYALEAADEFSARGIKALVVACNTASSLAQTALVDLARFPVFGVVEAGARAAVAATRVNRVGVIGTRSTVDSGAYVRTLEALSPGIEVHARACPLLVPLAEEGWEETDVARQVCEHYLADLGAARVDTLILGCTHYPLLERAIAAAMGPEVRLVDSAEETAREVARAMRVERLGRRLPPSAPIRFLVTDAPTTFVRVGTRLLGEPIADVESIELEHRLDLTDGELRARVS